MLFNVDADYHRFYLLPHFEHVGRVLDIAVGNFGDMHEPVLVNADIDERAEVDNIAHGAVYHHSDLQIFDTHYILAQLGCGERIPYVPAGTEKFGYDIAEGRNVEFGIFRRLLLAESLYFLRKFGKTARLYVLFGIAEEF